MTKDFELSVVNEHDPSKNSTVIDRQGNGVGQREYTLDEAVEAAKIGKYQTMLIIFTSLAVMGVGVENVGISYITPYAKCDLKLTMSQQAVFASVSFLGIVATSYFWGFLTDTWGRQKLLCLGAYGSFIFSCSSAFMTNTYAVITLRFLAGAMIAATQAGAYSYISEFHTTKTAPMAVALSTICLNGVSIYVSALAMFIIPLDFSFDIIGIEFRPWRLFMVCNASINLFNGIVFTFLPESPKFLAATNQKERALEVFRRVYVFNTGQPPESYPVKNIKIDAVGKTITKGFCNIIQLLWSQTKPIFLPPLLTHTWKMCYLIFALFSIGHGTFMWFPDFLVQLQNYDGPPENLCGVVQPQNTTVNLDDLCDNLDPKNTLSYQILLGVGGFFLISGLVASASMKKVSPKIIIFIWLGLSASTCFALNYLTGFNPIVFSFILFLSCCSANNIVMAVAVNLFPTNYRGMATSFILMWGRVGGFFGSNLVGLLLASMCSMVFYVNGALLISCMLLFLTVRSKNTST